MHCGLRIQSDRKSLLHRMGKSGSFGRDAPSSSPALDAGSLAASRPTARPFASGDDPRCWQALEERLGVRLLERSTRRLAPTEAGRRLDGPARRLLADYAEAMAEAPAGEGTAHGAARLRVAAPLVFGRLAPGPGACGLRSREQPGVRAELATGRPQRGPAGGSDRRRAADRPAAPKAGWWRGASASVRRLVAASPG